MISRYLVMVYLLKLLKSLTTVNLNLVKISKYINTIDKGLNLGPGQSIAIPLYDFAILRERSVLHK